MAIPIFLTAGALAPVITLITRYLVGTLIARTLFAIGFSVITYNSLQSIAGMIRSHFMALLGQTGSGQVYEIALALGIPSAANVIFSAYIGAVTIRVAMGLAKRVVFGNSGS